MLINSTFLLKDPTIIKGLLDGSLARYGGVIREAATGQIVRHLTESPGLTSQLMALPNNPLFGTASLVPDLIGHGITIHKLNKVQAMLSPILGLSQIAAGASVLNVGVSIAGFAYMGYKLNQIQTTLGKIQQSMEEGFELIDERLNQLSGQLAYLYLLVEQNRQGQKDLSLAITELHRTILIREIADLRAELLEKKRFANSSVQQALKTASRVRMVMCDRALQIQPQLEAEKMLLADVATQGWAVATATEAYLLLETSQIEEAQQLLNFEVPRFKENASRWADNLLTRERSELNTAYRFSAPHFTKHILSERVERIANITAVDRGLSQAKKAEKRNNIAIEFKMFYASKFDDNWVHKQIAIAEYLDTFSELSARLESLQDFTNLCQEKEVKSSRDLLPEGDREEWYILPR